MVFQLDIEDGANFVVAKAIAETAVMILPITEMVLAAIRARADLTALGLVKGRIVVRIYDYSPNISQRIMTFA